MRDVTQIGREEVSTLRRWKNVNFHPTKRYSIEREGVGHVSEHESVAWRSSAVDRSGGTASSQRVLWVPLLPLEHRTPLRLPRKRSQEKNESEWNHCGKASRMALSRRVWRWVGCRDRLLSFLHHRDEVVVFLRHHDERAGGAGAAVVGDPANDAEWDEVSRTPAGAVANDSPTLLGASASQACDSKAVHDVRPSTVW